jgi:hypothetical protein
MNACIVPGCENNGVHAIQTDGAAPDRTRAVIAPNVERSVVLGTLHAGLEMDIVIRPEAPHGRAEITQSANGRACTGTPARKWCRYQPSRGKRGERYQ